MTQAKEREAMKIGDAARLLKFGPQKLFKLLKEQNLISSFNNMPRPDLVTKGYFKTELRNYERGRTAQSYGINHPYTVTLVTTLGLAFLQELIDQHNAQHQTKESA